MTTKKDVKSSLKNSITKSIKENTHLFWNSYQHMYDVRERNIQNKINFLLIVATFLPMLSITLYTTKLFSNEIILIPIIFQIAALLILLKDFFIKGLLIHWFEFEPTLNLLYEDKFDVNFFSTLKALENGTYTNMEAKGKLIRTALILIVFSLYSILVSIVFVILHINILAYSITLAISFLFLALIIFYIKPIIFNIKSDHEEYVRKFDEWLKQKEGELKNETKK